MPSAIFSALKSIGKTIMGAAEGSGMPRLAEDAMGALGREGAGTAGMPSLGNRMRSVLGGAGETTRPRGLGGAGSSGMPSLGQARQSTLGAQPMPMASEAMRPQGRFGASAQPGRRAQPMPMASETTRPQGRFGGSGQRGQTANEIPMGPRADGRGLRTQGPTAPSAQGAQRLSEDGRRMGSQAEDLARRDMANPNRRLMGTVGNQRNTDLAATSSRSDGTSTWKGMSASREGRRMIAQAGRLGAGKSNFDYFIEGVKGGLGELKRPVGQFLKHGGDILGVSAIGGVMGGIHGAMTYDPNQERDPLLAQTPTIGRFKAAAKGALKGAAYGAAGATGAKAFQFGIGAGIRNTDAAKFANTDTILGSFARGFKGMNVPGDLPVAQAANRGRQTAGEAGYYNYSQVYKSTDVAAAARANVKATGSIKNLQRDIRATKARLPDLKEFGALSEAQQKLVGATEIPSMIATGVGGLVGTVAHAAKAVAHAYKTHIIEPSRAPASKATSAGFGRILNPNYEGAASEAAGIKRTLSRDVTAPFVAGVGILGGATFGLGGAISATSYGAPAGHPMNAIFRAGDSAITAKAQMEADAAQKIKMQRPTMLGLNDTDEAYYTNPALRPRRESRHTPGKYNDDGSLVFALSNLRRA